MEEGLEKAKEKPVTWFCGRASIAEAGPGSQTGAAGLATTGEEVGAGLGERVSASAARGRRGRTGAA